MKPELIYSQGIGTGEICLTTSPLLVGFMVTLSTEVLLYDISGVFKLFSLQVLHDPFSLGDKGTHHSALAREMMKFSVLLLVRQLQCNSFLPSF